jgi:hypothetical protein
MKMKRLAESRAAMPRYRGLAAYTLRFERPLADKRKKQARVDRLELRCLFPVNTGSGSAHNKFGLHKCEFILYTCQEFLY